MDAVDVEEERDHEDEQHAIVRNAAHGGEQALEGEGDIVQNACRAALALLAKTLLIRTQQRDSEREPPCARDEERQTRAGEGIEAKDARPAKDEGDA